MINSIRDSIDLLFRILDPFPAEKEKDVIPQDVIPIFFADISKYYFTDEKGKVDKGEVYFRNEINKYMSKERILKAIGTQITILSSNITKKFSWISISYISILASILFMSFFTLFKFYSIADERAKLIMLLQTKLLLKEKDLILPTVTR